MQFDLRSMMEHMGGVAWGVVITLASCPSTRSAS